MVTRSVAQSGRVAPATVTASVGRPHPPADPTAHSAHSSEPGRMHTRPTVALGSTPVVSPRRTLRVPPNVVAYR